MRDHFLQLADYNIWANGRIYDAAEAVGEAARRRETGAYFTDLHGTLAHILVADRLWMARLERRPQPYRRLDDMPHDDWRELRAARVEQDAAIRDFIERQSNDDIESPLVYSSMTGSEHVLPRRIILTHMFNHATHHRGQAHHQLRQLGVAEPPALDLPYYVLGLA
jgi:uncharacterized damage-inducible protein DinB